MINVTIAQRRAQVVNDKSEEEEFEFFPLPIDNVLEVMYTPDSQGRLDLSLGLLMSDNSRPELRQYAEQRLLRSDKVSPSDCKDVDVALENVIPFSLQYGEERQYVARSALDKLKNFVTPNKDK